MGMTYDLHRLTPGGATVEHIAMPQGGRMETDGPWLFLYDTAGVAVRCLPAHVVLDVRACAGGGECGAAT